MNDEIIKLPVGINPVVKTAIVVAFLALGACDVKKQSGASKGGINYNNYYQIVKVGPYSCVLRTYSGDISWCERTPTGGSK